MSTVDTAALCLNTKTLWLKLKMLKCLRVFEVPNPPQALTANSLKCGHKVDTN